MKLILFTNSVGHPACQLFTNALEQLSVPFRVITTSPVLHDIMIKMRTDEALFVFLLIKMDDMTILNEIRSQIQDCKIITILPDDSEQARSIGRSVLPRYQASLSDDLSLVAEIAARIVSTDINDQKP